METFIIEVVAGLVTAVIVGGVGYKIGGLRYKKAIRDAPNVYAERLGQLIQKAYEEGVAGAVVNSQAIVSIRNEMRSMRGAVVAMAKMGGIRFLQGEDMLTSYRFHTGAAQHFFCSLCGIYTHHQRRSDQNLYAVNVACLDGVSPFDFPEVPVTDGVNHPSDTGKPSRRAGTLRFIAAD